MAKLAAEAAGSLIFSPLDGSIFSVNCPGEENILSPSTFWFTVNKMTA